MHHDRCAMKVGTDGVLLGAWANAGRGKMILDVGTGTGLIALMMAQRYPGAAIRAIDIDRDAVAQARENVDDSPFADRMTVEQDDFRHYASACAEKFDLIVSNPPWFNRALLPPDAQRKTARHSISLTLTELLLSAANCLSPEGVLALILPYDQQKELETQARE
ncbi:MAG: methyltransferase, partial [Proteiniphilum sp.]|nr:methyltransferase [Proteiniphilum sp.]